MKHRCCLPTCSSMGDATPLFLNGSLPAIIPKSVYRYANMVRGSLETPRQTKLDHDVSAILGSSDPPAGFGFLHPRFYSLEQNRPTPMEPLQVRRLIHFSSLVHSILFAHVVFDDFIARVANREINLSSSETSSVYAWPELTTTRQSFLVLCIQISK